MKRILITLGVLMLVGFGGLAMLTNNGWAQSLPACATDGDKDGDGVADAVDSDEYDSCQATSGGYENCTTGAGDGLPDCQ